MQTNETPLYATQGNTINLKHDDAIEHNNKQHDTCQVNTIRFKARRYNTIHEIQYVAPHTPCAAIHDNSIHPNRRSENRVQHIAIQYTTTQDQTIVHTTI